MAPFKRGALLATSLVAVAALHCGGASPEASAPGPTRAGAPGTKERSRTAKLEDSCHAGFYEKCIEALATPEAYRPGVFAILCRDGSPYPEMCCRARAEFAGSSNAGTQQVHDKAIGICSVLCSANKGEEFCEPFRGPDGEENRAKACEQYFPSPTHCDGLAPARIAQIQKAKNDRESHRRAEAARRAEIDNRQAVRPSPRQPPPVATSAAPQRRRTSCQYMFLTGGRNGSSYTKAERHFYDAPDCGGACCSGQSFCCVERGSGKEFCSKSSGQSTDSEPEAHYCSGAASRRDQPRDDYPPLPVLP